MTDLSTLKTAMLDRYNALAYAHEYLMGFTYKKVVYCARLNERDLEPLVSIGEASRGGYSLRFRPTNAVKASLLNRATALCTVDEFKAICASNQFNKGENFEKIVTEAYGQVWEKDSVPFWKGADLTANGVHYQIKFQEATFTSEQILSRIPA